MKISMKRVFFLAAISFMGCLSLYAKDSWPTSLLIMSVPNKGINSHSGVKTSPALVLTGSLVSFDAAYGHNFFSLNWDASAATQYDHFEVERSLDGTHFKKIGEIKALSAGPADGKYTYKDNIRPVVTRKNDLYYRLKEVDANGETTYSKVLVARMYNTSAVASLSVTPDPQINDILVNVQLKQRSFAVMRVTDRDGNEILKKTAHVDEGLTTYQLDDTHQLQPGEYMLEIIINSSERMDVKLIKD